MKISNDPAGGFFEQAGDYRMNRRGKGGGEQTNRKAGSKAGMLGICLINGRGVIQEQACEHFCLLQVGCPFRTAGAGFHPKSLRIFPIIGIYAMYIS